MIGNNSNTTSSKSNNNITNNNQSSNNSKSNNSNVSVSNNNNTNIPSLNNNEYYKCSLGKYCLRNKKDLTKAYYVENNNLFRVNIPEDTYTCMAEGADSVYFEENGDLMVKLNKKYTIYENDDNIIYSEYDACSTDSIVSEFENDILNIQLKSNGSLSVRILNGALANNFGIGVPIGLENIRFNIYSNAHSIKNSDGTMCANAKKFYVWHNEKENKWFLIYANCDNVILFMDINYCLNAKNSGSRDRALYTSANNIIDFVNEKSNTNVDKYRYIVNQIYDNLIVIVDAYENTCVIYYY